MKKIAVLTGDSAPGMNAAIRAVVRQGIGKEMDVYGIQGGLTGLIDGNIIEMSLEIVCDLIHRGGSVLQYSHFEGLENVDIQQKALDQIENLGIEGLIILGGNRTMRAAEKLSSLGVPTVGIPVTINNDIAGTEYTIGFDTAVNTVVEAIDKIRYTASSNERTYVIEVAGGRVGNIALWSGVCTGAESIIIPEAKHDVEDITDRIHQEYERGKNHNIIVVAEGVGVGAGKELGKIIQEKTNLDTKVTILGLLQRGGPPSAYDRMISSQMAAESVDLLVEGKKGIMIGLKNGRLIHTPFEELGKDKPGFDHNTYQLARSLATY
ncbi:ATP-dependent 6-phosphofructokinase [Salipaludibacillus neizhouensis]|uniref:6-phosphofructokinase n=1 Tax=Salipaludibacillus neizhouensis TaxID=885475 RepID=A0A3A9K538_9BACI|nr:ATP-dependent 6-phosphofructokinase [Salipaludibacillus neizhouensis]RKL66468.1 ATP-dependent 6-phosphofructokinase [Salipaludibacillus neizhouensis]